MELKDLKSGMKVYLRDGTDYYVLRGNLIDNDVKLMTSIEDNFTNELKHKTNKKKDIVEVYTENDDLYWFRSSTNWEEVPMNTKCLVSDDGLDWHLGYFYRCYGEGYQVFDKPMDFRNNLSDICVYWNFIKPCEEKQVTAEELKEKFNFYCSQFSFDDCQSDKCKYKEYDELGVNLCKVNWFLDHYNLTEKEV